MNKFLKWLLITIGIGVLLYVGFFIYAIVVFSGAFDSHYTEHDLVDNCNAKTKEITALKKYINSIVPAGKGVEIEFDGSRTLSIFHVIEQGNYDSHWDVSASSPQAEILLKKLGWTQETLSALKEKLDDADCISIESGEPCTIGYKRSGMGMYSYKIFDKPLNDSLKSKYNDSCQYIFYKENIVLEYGGGAVGPQCFEDLKNR